MVPSLEIYSSWSAATKYYERISVSASLKGTKVADFSRAVLDGTCFARY